MSQTRPVFGWIRLIMKWRWPRRIPIATGAGEAIEGKAETKKLKSA